MPEYLHRKIAKSARKKGLKGDRFNAYVYSTLDKIEKRKKKKHSNLAKPGRDSYGNS